MPSPVRDRRHPHSLSRLFAAAGLTAVLVVAPLVAAIPATAAQPSFELGNNAAPLGMGTDVARDRYWVLNDRSGQLTLHAWTGEGGDEGRMNSRDRVGNVQAMAFVGGEAWVGDIGGRRSQVTIYRVTEPWPGTEILNAPAYRFAYPDGQQQSSFAMMVDSSQRIFIVTTGEKPGIYAAPEQLDAATVQPLVRVADAPAGITDATVLTDGRWVLRSASTLHTLDPATHAVLGEAEIGGEEKGQSLTQTIDGAGVLTGAGTDGVLSVHPIPGPQPTQEPPAPGKAPAAAGSTEGDVPATYAQTGTTTAVVAALAVAVICAIVVLLRR